MKKRICSVIIAACLTATVGFPAAAAQTGNTAAAAQETQTAQTGQDRVIRVLEQNASVIKNALNVVCAPSGILAAADGSILVTDTYNKQVISIRDGVSTVYAGKTGVQDIYGESVGGYHDGKNTECLFSEPWAIAPFKDGYAVSDTGNNVIRLVLPTETKTFTGRKLPGYQDGDCAIASFNDPTGLAFDGKETLYVADTGNGAIRMVTSYGKVSTLMGNLSEPTGLCYKNGSLYVAESGANRVLKITDGTVTEVYGSGTEGYADGAQDQAQFSCPQGVAVADDGTVYISDTGNSAVRKVSGKTVTTVFLSDPSSLERTLVSPRGLLAAGDRLYVCDNFSRKILIIGR